MATCVKSGKTLPEINVHLKGYECRENNRIYCQYFSRCFIDGTNCVLLRKPRDIRRILGIEAANKNV